MALSAPATPTPAQAPADLTSTRVASPLLLNRSSPSGGQLQPLAPTYIGCLESNEDVLFLLQGCFSGILKHSIPGTRGVTSACRSGCIFIWEEKISGIEYWNDGLSWTSVVRDGHFWIRRETTTDCELERKTISILAQGRLHHVESYEDPWDMTLQRPSQDSRLRDMTLNKELTSQRKGQYALSRDTQCLRVILKVDLSHSITPGPIALTTFRPVRVQGSFYSCGALSFFFGLVPMTFCLSSSYDEGLDTGTLAFHPVGNIGLNFAAKVSFGACHHRNSRLNPICCFAG